jgi:hypothetical protein
MNPTREHHSNKLSSSVAFKLEAPGLQKLRGTRRCDRPGA